jgi:hypothetical protein
MMSPQLQTIAGIAIGRILNSLPEGLFLALFVWMMLRVLPRQNSGTRFAVWLVALLAVAGLPVAGFPLIGDIAGGHTLPAFGHARSLITIPGALGVLLFVAWVLAAGAALLRLTAGLWQLRGLRRSCIAINPATLDLAIQKTVAEFSSSRAVTLATSENVSVPAAIGFFKPMIVIPAWALQELPPEELNIILLHEFAHLRRWDDWTNLLQKIVRCVFLFHPAVWWIDSQLALEREMACDDEVLAETANPPGYAKCLISLFEKSFAHRGCPIVCAVVLLCLMVVPRVPESLAFDRSTPEIVGRKSNVQAAALSRPEFPAAKVIPAALRPGASPSLKTKRRADSGQVGSHIQRPAVQRPVIEEVSNVPKEAAAHNLDDGSSPVDVVMVGANEMVVPGETLVVVRTTQRVGPNAWVWSVSMWRVTWVNLGQDEKGTSPVPKKT